MKATYYNSSFMECQITDYFEADRYVIGVSTNSGFHWVYSYNYPIIYVSFPDIYNIYPSIVPINLKTKMTFSFNSTEMHL